MVKRHLCFRVLVSAFRRILRAQRGRVPQMNLRRASRKSYGAGSQGARRVGRKPRPERATRGGSTPGATKHAPARRGPLRSGPAAIERPSELTPRWPDVSGLLKRQNRRFWLTRRGMLLANEVMAVFV